MPTVPPDLALTASHEQDGVRVDVVLDRNPLPAGEPTWATLTVTNVGAGDVSWLHDGCEIPASLHGLTSATWRPGPLSTGLSPKYEFRAAARRAYWLDGESIVLDFEPEAFVGRGSFGCADIGITEQLGSGRSLTQRARWGGFAGRTLGLPPGGAATLVVWAGYYWRTADGEPVDGQASVPIRFEFSSWVTGGKDPALLDPTEIVDAAITDAEFGAWLGRSYKASGQEPLLWFDDEEQVWHVELLSYFEPEYWIHGVTVDPWSGEVVGVVDHAWDGSFEHHG